MSRRQAIKRWWNHKPGSPAIHGDVFAAYRLIRQQSHGRREQDRHHMELYANLDVAGNGFSALTLGERRRSRYNLCQSAIDTAASVIAQQRPKPQYLTTEGDFGLQRQARLRTRVLEGQLYDTGAYDLGPRCFVDAAVTGTAAIYGYDDPITGEPRLERCLPGELCVEQAEALYGKPQTLYRVRLVARDVLCELYPKHAKQIQNAEGTQERERRDLWLTHTANDDDLVCVVESWRLGVGDACGRHILACSGCVLVDEEFDEPEFPFAFYRWAERQVGFWGMGICEQVRDAQWRINHLVRRINDLSDLGSNMHVWAQGDVKVEQLSNLPARIYRTNGPAPQFVTVNAVPTELFSQIAQIRDEAFSMLGISTMMAEGKKPSGLDSGAAQRAHDDILSRRHVMNAKNYERFYMDVVRLLERLNERASKKNGGYKVAARTQRGRTQLVKMVKWSEVSLPENKYRLTMFPTSALPTTPAGKMAAVQEWVAGGMISRPFAQSLLDFPDLDAATRIELADLDLAMFHVEQLLDGEDVVPSAYQDLQLAADIARKSLLQAEINGADDDVMDALRQYIDDCRSMEQLAQAAMAPPGPPQPMPSPAPQGALPPEMTGGVMMQ